MDDERIVEIGRRAYDEWALKECGWSQDDVRLTLEFPVSDCSIGPVLTILAALREAGLVVEQGWQPIETAPKDGITEVLIWTPEGIDIAVYSKREEDGLQSMGHDAGWWGTATPADPGRSMGNPDYFREPYCQPTHWRPLPTPPDPQ